MRRLQFPVQVRRMRNSSLLAAYDAEARGTLGAAADPVRMMERAMCRNGRAFCTVKSTLDIGSKVGVVVLLGNLPRDNPPNPTLANSTSIRTICLDGSHRDVEVGQVRGASA